MIRWRSTTERGGGHPRPAPVPLSAHFFTPFHRAVLRCRRGRAKVRDAPTVLFFQRDPLRARSGVPVGPARQVPQFCPGVATFLVPERAPQLTPTDAVPPPRQRQVKSIYTICEPVVRRYVLLPACQYSYRSSVVGMAVGRPTGCHVRTVRPTDDAR